MSKFSAEVIYKERIVATKLGLDVSPEDQMKIAEDIGPVFKPDDDRSTWLKGERLNSIIKRINNK